MRSGKEAIEELERDAARFRALVTDVNLGTGPSGWDVAHRARELSPEIAVVYMTGGNAHEWPANGVPKSSLLNKPFASAQAIAAVTALLNASGGNATG